jgi:sRNA-binding protein
VQERTQREVKEANERRISARVVNLAALAERFPSVFNADKPLPLAIRTDKAVREALALPWSRGNDLLHWWTHKPAYYQALTAGGQRYNIDGAVNGDWLARTTATPDRDAEIAARMA